MTSAPHTHTLTPAQVGAFQEVIWAYYHAHGRSMPWRTAPTAYHVLVSELMLQQTQVARVIPKFEHFMTLFPTFERLAGAELAEVLTAWSGLGYNRRAKFLWLTAQAVVENFDGTLPQATQELLSLPGIGKNTAGAIQAYAFNQPVVFIETNIRTVFFHYFFSDTVDTITDAQLVELVLQTLDQEHPREWYWALMDYGAHLKATAGGRLTQSRHYKKQSPLKGSMREMRGKIITALTRGRVGESQLRHQVEADERFEKALGALVDEGLVMADGDDYRLTASSDSR